MSGNWKNEERIVARMFGTERALMKGTAGCPETVSKAEDIIQEEGEDSCTYSETTRKEAQAGSSEPGLSDLYHERG
jgi:hypothetical protein